MVIDTSALLAIVLGEDDSAEFVDAIARREEERSSVYIPASVIVAAGIVAERHKSVERLDGLLEQISAEVVPLDRTIAELARTAYRVFGRGFHKAALNFGDCMSYATALYLREPLLYKGGDFRKTDIPSALAMPN